MVVCSTSKGWVTTILIYRECVDLAIIRKGKGKENPYSQVSNKIINDPNLSAKAKGILIYILSKPDDWQIYEVDIVNHFKDGRDSISAGIKELVKARYIYRERTRDENGRLSNYEYVVYEEPFNHIGLSNVGFPNVGESNTSNTVLNKTDLNKTDFKIYIDLPIDDHIFLNIYNRRFKTKFNKDHMGVTEEQLEFIMSNIGELVSYDVDEDTFIYKSGVYFENLPKSNNGNILSFIRAFPRIFEIQNTEQMGLWG